MGFKYMKYIQIVQITAGMLNTWDSEKEKEVQVPAVFALCEDNCIYVREAYTGGGEWELLDISPTE